MDKIIAMVKNEHISLDYDLTLIHDTNAHTINIINDTGETHVCIHYLPNGMLEITSKRIQIVAEEQLKLAAPHIDIHADKNLRIHSNGYMSTSVAQDALVDIKGQHVHKAHTQQLKSTHGNVEVRANDDVKIDGERIKLNSVE
jgi:phage gp45-like